jgi:Rab-like protein 3
MSAIDKVRILVCGDSSVGKSSFVSLIANNEVASNLQATIGVQIEIKLFDYESKNHQKTFFIEFFDVGSSMNHKNARSVFYQQINGIILVHDLTNRKSQENLKYWLLEILNKEGKDTMKGGAATTIMDDLDTEQFFGYSQVRI